MFRMILVGVVLLLAQSPSWAKLEVKNIQASQGPFGPERTSLDIAPNDEIFFRFQVHGIQINKEGKTELEESIVLKNSDGKAVFENKGVVSRPLALGGNQLTTQVLINIGAKAPPGEYTLTVSLKDRINGETTSFEKKLTCKAPTFAILVPRFYRDAESKIPAPVGGIVNDTLFFKVICVGFDKKDKQVKVNMNVQIIDDKGADVLPKPIEVKATITKAEDVEKAIKLNFDGSIYLSRAGEFRIRITMEDLQSKQTAKFETPLKVVTP